VKLLERYGEVLRGHGTAGPLAASVVGRMALGMNSLAILLLVRESTGSYAAAGAVAALHALSFAVFGPRRARAADRGGPVGVLRATAVLHPAGLALLVLLAAYDAPVVALALPAVLAGAAGPPVGAVMRALWPQRVSGRPLATAYALESVVVELCFVVGPLLTAGLAATLGPSAAVLAAGMLALAGSLWLSATPAVRSVRPQQHCPPGRFGPLASPAVRALLLTVLAIGAGFGALEVALPAFVEELGAQPAAAGVLLAVWSAGSIAGGLVYGAVHLPVPQRRQLPVLVVALAVGAALPLLAAGPVAMAVALFGYGLTIAPLFACNSVLLGEAAPPGTVTEAFAWNTSMIFGGAALGNAAAGVLAERVSPYSALLLAAATGTVAAALSVVGLFRLGRAAPRLP
jgi:predicted MFS family arabinose efflux permease